MLPILNRFKHVNFYLFEAFLMVRFVSAAISVIAISLLIQDKICLNQFEQNATYCQNIQLESDSPEEKRIQNLILAETTTFSLYKNGLECIPMFAWSLFVGSFLDRYPSGTTFLLFSNVVGSLATYMIYIFNVRLPHASVYYLLIGSGPILFTGGMTTLLVVVFRYITVNTAENERSYKFVVLEIIFVIGFSGAGFLGGQLLQLKDIVDKNQFIIRTYNRNFIISILLDALSMFLLYLLRKTEKSRLDEKLQLQKIIEDEIQELLANDENDNRPALSSPELPIKSSSMPAPSYGTVNSVNFNPSLEGEDSIEELINKGRMRKLFSILFDFDNLRQTLVCFSKPRPNRIRMQIFLLYFVLFLQLLTTQGMSAVFLQFAERVYQWDSERYSTLNALSQVISMALLALGTGIFIKWLKWVDETLIILSLISTFLRHSLMGAYLSENAFFTSLFVGSLSGFTVVTIRTKISKIVPEEEIGKIFSLSSSMESLVPLGGSLIFSNLFTWTISSYPGFIYQFAAILILLSLALTVFEEVYCPVKSYHDFLASNGLRRRYSSNVTPVLAVPGTSSGTVASGSSSPSFKKKKLPNVAELTVELISEEDRTGELPQSPAIESSPVAPNDQSDSTAERSDNVSA